MDGAGGANLDQLREDCAIKQKRGIHFILASVAIWVILFIIQSTGAPILTKNFLTFCFSALLLPLAYGLSRVVKIDFQNAGNPLTNLGITFSLNQILYLFIAVWAYAAVPDKMLMIIAIIFGAHLLPFGWLYRSRMYGIFSVAIPIVALMVSAYFSPVVLAGTMVVVEIVFSLLVFVENRNLPATA